MLPAWHILYTNAAYVTHIVQYC